VQPTSEPGVLSFRNDAGEDVFVHAWAPLDTAHASAQAVRAVVVVAHGMAEHGARYARFGQALSARGYAVYAPDHRGHGRTAGGDERLGWAGADGWNGMVRDLERLLALARAVHPGAPLVLFGHSMGSVLAQRVAQLRGRELVGLILSGTFGAAPGLALAITAASALAFGPGARKPSPLLKQRFAEFNRLFAAAATESVAPDGNAETGFEWLSRDAAEVRKYVEDPRCGFAFSNRLTLDMLRGYGEVWKPASEARLPKELSVLLFAGERDPVGNDTAAVKALAERYRALGLRDVRTVFYPDARHETLNETNRDEVTRDVLAWLDGRTARA
jgi:alpha-beta hydrolase superfamily lysophospholipase